MKLQLLGLTTYAALTVIFAALVNLFVHAAFRVLWLPMVLLFGCGVLFSLLVYWALQSRGKTGFFPFRFALASLVYLPLFAVVIAFGAFRVGIVSWSTLLQYYCPAILPGAVFTSAVIYLLAKHRRMKSAKE